MSNGNRQDSSSGRSLENSFTETIGRRLNHDFCPSLNRYVDWLKQPLGWIVCSVLFSGLVGVLISSHAFAFMWSLIAFLIVGIAWPWLSMKGVSCNLKFAQSRSREGSKTVATLLVTNRFPVPVFGLMVTGEFLQEITVDDDRIAIGLQRIPALSTSKFRWEFEPQRRGVLPVSQPVLKNGFPFGLYHCQKSFDVDGKTIVWPQETDLSGFPEVQGANFDIDGLMSDRSGNDGDVIGARNFRNGDSLRHINWAKTSTQGQLITQERQTCAQQPIRVLIDLSVDSHCGSNGQSSYEWAIRIAASICQQLHRHRSQVTLICLGLPHARTGANNKKGMRPLLDFLAMLPDFSDADPSPKASASSEFGKRIRSNELKTICIKTSASDLDLTLKDSHTIQIDLEQFEIAEGGRKTQIAEGKPSRSCASRRHLVITAPQKASEELQSGWRRSCEHVA